MVPIQIRITKKVLKEIEGIIKLGRYSSRSEFVREALRSHLDKE